MISVCIPTYNGEKFILEQLKSILCQIGPDDEVIISDDSSLDKTVEIIESINDERIKILKNNKFHSPIFNLENALKQAKGDVIFLSDQDDIWLPNKVETIMNLLKENNCVLSDATIINAEGSIMHQSFFQLNHTRQGLLNNLIKNGFIGCCMAFDRTVLDRSLPFPSKIGMHDWWIGLVAEKSSKVYFCRQPLIYYRRHGANASVSSEKSRTPIIKRINQRIYLIRQLIKV